MLAAIEGLRDLIPLLIFVLLPLLGRVFSWVNKKTGGQDPRQRSRSERPPQTTLGEREQVGSPLAGGGMPAFLEPEPETFEPELPTPPPVQTVPRSAQASHSPKGESLKEMLSHRAPLSMDDQIVRPRPAKLTSSKLASSDLGNLGRSKPKRSTEEVAIWGSQGGRVRVAGQSKGMGNERQQALRSSELRQAMIWHEILSKPVSLREPDEAPWSL